MSTQRVAGSDSGMRFKFSSRTGKGSAFKLNVDLELPGTGITAIFGQSGSGKTSLLRCIAGLTPVDGGELSVNNETWHCEGGSLPAWRRSVGFVFQEASLFKHLTADQNLDFAQRRAIQSSVLIDRDEITELMGIRSLLSRKPDQLSGGERQRVAIARALLINPRLLLLDEPLAALDVNHKHEIMPYLEQLHRRIQIPVLYVTHSVDEVSRLADHLVVMDAGRVAASGEVGPILSSLNLGDEAGAVLEGQIVEKDEGWNLVLFTFDGGELWLRDRGNSESEKIRIRVLARDVSLSLQKVTDSSILNSLPARVVDINESDPAMALVRLQLGNSTILARVSRRSVSQLGLETGSNVWAQVKSVAILR